MEFIKKTKCEKKSSSFNELAKIHKLVINHIPCQNYSASQSDLFLF